MAISYPRSLPNLNDIASVGFQMEAKIGISEGQFDFGQQVQDWNQGRWSVVYTLVPMPRSKADVWLAWLASMRGKGKTFLGVLSPDTTSKGTASDSAAPLVDGASQTGTSLVINSAPASESGYFLAGDFIQLGDNDSTARIHMVLQDVNTGTGDGSATLDIWPDLYSSPADNATVTVSNPRGLMRLKNNVHQVTINNAQEYISLKFEAESAL